ncbi:MAG: type I CRISPR-associated protein Cas7 [Bacteroidetes bacterium]|nr:type I CRISPR-associated protein Cas7 [Bacteroidota bacterium]
MSKTEFKNRVLGCVILKSINSNFNADFTHHPRTLPDGVVYSTDKALKYAVKDYFRKHNAVGDNIFYIKRLNESLNPLTLDETYIDLFGEYPKKKTKKKDKESEEINRLEILKNLLSCVDIRLFGATFAGETNISIHGTVQINHGVNRFPENQFYTEDILSPFRNPGEEGSAEKGMSTIGNQTNLKEGHYVFHFSVNPKNTEELYKKVNDNTLFLSNEDIQKLKEAFNNSVTALDSSRKIGTENEATVFVQLNEGSKKMLPSLTELVNVKRNGEKVEIDCSLVQQSLQKIDSDVMNVEVYYNPINTIIKGIDKNIKTNHLNILNNEEIK